MSCETSSKILLRDCINISIRGFIIIWGKLWLISRLTFNIISRHEELGEINDPISEGISPDIFTISVGNFKFTLYWYALAYVVGILAWWQIAAIALKKTTLWPGNTPPMQVAKLEDLVTYLVLGIIIGGRLGYVIFYKPTYFLANPVEIMFVWQGGMSFHGGLFGVALAGFLFFTRNSIAIRSVADLLALGSPVGLFIGRVANFINDELWGRTTDVPWGFIVTSREASIVCGELISPCVRHPSQLYEAILEGLILFS